MKKSLFVFLFCSLFITPLYAQQFLWGKYGMGDAYIGNIQADSKGNCYLAGQIPNDTVHFGGYTIMNSTITNAPFSSYFDPFLVKYDVKGNLLWVKQWIEHDTSQNHLTVLPATTANGSNGNVYLNGNFTDTLIIGTYTVVANGGLENTCVTKYDSSGNIKWIRASKTSINNSAWASGEYISCDDYGNTFLLGSGSYDTVYFGAYKLFYNYNIYFNDFLVKYDSAGNVKWAKQAVPHNANSGCVSHCITNDRLGNTFSTGEFGDSVQYGTYLLADAFWSYSDFDIVKWDSTGTISWAKQGKKTSISCAGVGAGVTTDKNGNVYACGTFLDTLILGQDTVKDPVYGRQNFFVAKYDPNGNVLWVKQATILDSNIGWSAWSLSSDNYNHIYLSANGGFGKCKIVFGGDTVDFRDTSKNDGASILFKLDSNGSARCSTIIPAGTGWALPGFTNSISSDTSGKYVYVGGNAGTPVVFGIDTVNPYSVPINHIQQHNFFPFAARWEACDSNIFQAVPEDQKPLSSLVVYPNPNNGNFIIALQNINEPAHIEIYNTLGERVQSKKLNANSTQIEMRNQSNGVYFYRVLQENGSLIGSGKVVIER